MYVYDPAYYNEGERPCDFKDVHCKQGFFAWPGMFVFFIITDNPPIHIDVYFDESVLLGEDTVRAIKVPFKVISDEGIVIEPLFGHDPRTLAIPKGDYALVFEQRYMDIWTEADMTMDSTPPSYLQSNKHTWDVAQEREDFLADGGKIEEFWRMPMVMSRIWLNPATNVEAKILVQDTAENSNYPLNPTYPLVIDEPPASILKG